MSVYKCIISFLEGQQLNKHLQQHKNAKLSCLRDSISKELNSLTDKFTFNLFNHLNMLCLYHWRGKTRGFRCLVGI